MYIYILLIVMECTLRLSIEFLRLKWAVNILGRTLKITSTCSRRSRLFPCKKIILQLKMCYSDCLFCHGALSDIIYWVDFAGEQVIAMIFELFMSFQWPDMKAMQQRCPFSGGKKETKQSLVLHYKKQMTLLVLTIIKGKNFLQAK